MARAALRELSCEAVDASPSHYEWDGTKYDSDETGNGWTFVEATRCEKCKRAIVGGGGEAHNVTDPDSGCEGWVPECEGPMMTTFYPLRIDDTRAAALLLVDLPLCVVTVDGETGLALTGGGMDLSWEICHAHMLLGFLPPVAFADLPGMAGKDPDSKRNRWIVAGCLKSCAVSAQWAQSKARRLRSTVKSMREHNAKTRAA